MSKRSVNISIPEELFSRTKRAAEIGKFKSIDDFIAYLSRDAVTKVEAKWQEFFREKGKR